MIGERRKLQNRTYVHVLTVNRVTAIIGYNYRTAFTEVSLKLLHAKTVAKQHTSLSKARLKKI